MKARIWRRVEWTLFWTGVAIGAVLVAVGPVIDETFEQNPTVRAENEARAIREELWARHREKHSGWS